MLWQSPFNPVAGPGAVHQVAGMRCCCLCQCRRSSGGAEAGATDSVRHKTLVVKQGMEKRNKIRAWKEQQEQQQHGCATVAGQHQLNLQRLEAAAAAG